MADKDSDNEDLELTIADEAVVTKYKTAGEIANRKYNSLVFPWIPSALVLNVVASENNAKSPTSRPATCH